MIQIKHWYIKLHCRKCNKTAGREIWSQEDDYKFIGCESCRDGVMIVIAHGAYTDNGNIHVEICDYPSGI